MSAVLSHPPSAYQYLPTLTIRLFPLTSDLQGIHSDTLIVCLFSLNIVYLLLSLQLKYEWNYLLFVFLTLTYFAQSDTLRSFMFYSSGKQNKTFKWHFPKAKLLSPQEIENICGPNIRKKTNLVWFWKQTKKT